MMVVKGKAQEGFPGRVSRYVLGNVVEDQLIRMIITL